MLMAYLRSFYALTAAATVGYLLGVAILVVRAWRYPANPRRLPGPFDVFRPKVFSPAGQPYRRRALRFLLLGGAIVACCWAIALLA